MDHRGYIDIGYNFLICDDNDDQQKIYTGRGWNYIGSHCRTYNQNSLGKNMFLFLKLSRTVESCSFVF
jgi:hypothetical protein